MSGKKDKGPAGNPWVRNDSESGADENAAPESELPPSPWDLEVPPQASPWTTPAPGPDAGAQGGGSQSGGSQGGWGPGAGDGSGGPGGPARETTSAWGDKVGPPSLRRPEPVKKKPAVPPLLIPIAAGIGVVALVAVALILLTGGDEKPGPTSSPSVTVTTPPASTYTPPPNAIPVAFGVHVVPVDGWSVLPTETEGKELVTYAPNRDPRAFFWVRQKQNVSAQEYALRIVEGETSKEVAQLGNLRNLSCPRDVLVECVAISYTSTAEGIKVKGYVEAYKRKDGLVTALDFRTRVDFAPKAEADAETMKKSVIDSL